MRARVGHVAGNVEPVLEKPQTRPSKGKRLAFSPEADGQSNREDELPDRATVRLEASAEQTDNGMTGLMKQQVGVVDQKDEPALRGEEKQRKKGCADGKANQLARRHGVPRFVWPGSQRGHFAFSWVNPPNFHSPPKRFMETASMRLGPSM